MDEEQKCKELEKLLERVKEQLFDERKGQQDYGSFASSLRNVGLSTDARIVDGILSQECEHELQLIELKRVIEEELRKCNTLEDGAINYVRGTIDRLGKL